MLPEPEQAIRAVGPWTHRNVSANGSRFHIVEAGTGPAVLLLHGFPMYWWTWRRQIETLAADWRRLVEERYTVHSMVDALLRASTSLPGAPAGIS